jgi:AcrR family transcriptional regulator
VTTREATTREITRRQQRTADSRARILDAAVECLVDGGYAAATTLRIQARAEVSRGRLLHHFPSREVLLVAAAQHLAGRRLRAAQDRAAGELLRHPDGPPRWDRAVELMWAMHHEPHYWAAVELWTAARTDDRIAAALRTEERRLGGVVRDVVDVHFGPAATGHPRYPQLRELLLTSMRGVALAYAFERRDPLTDPHLQQWRQAARLLLGAAEVRR